MDRLTGRLLLVLCRHKISTGELKKLDRRSSNYSTIWSECSNLMNLNGCSNSNPSQKTISRWVEPITNPREYLTLMASRMRKRMKNQRRKKAKNLSAKKKETRVTCGDGTGEQSYNRFGGGGNDWTNAYFNRSGLSREQETSNIEHVLQHHRQMHDELTTDLSRMAQQLKLNSQSFGDTLSKDDKVRKYKLLSEIR